MSTAPQPSYLDSDQVLRHSFDDAAGRLRVETAATIVAGAVEVAVDASTDSVAVKDPITGYALKVNSDGSLNVSSSSIGANVSITQGGNTAIVNASGQLLVSGNTVVSGTVTTIEAGLNNFQTSQYTIGTSAIQITPSPLANRTSISLRVSATTGNAIYIGNNAGTTIANGYPLYNGDTLQMDLTPTNSIYAIATAAGQTLATLEIA